MAEILICLRQGERKIKINLITGASKFVTYEIACLQL
jgi:hypothetical protein